MLGAVHFTEFVRIASAVIVIWPPSAWALSTNGLGQHTAVWIFGMYGVDACTTHTVVAQPETSRALPTQKVVDLGFVNLFPGIRATASPT
jgi:hypothetical protein